MARPEAKHLVTSLGFLIVGLAAAGLGPLLRPHVGPGAILAHVPLLMWGFLLPSLYFLHAHSLGLWDRTAHVERVRAADIATGAGAIVLVYPALAPTAWPVAIGGMLILAAGAVLHVLSVLPLLPRTATTDDPLTKGDDACLKHLRISHMMLPVALLLLAIGSAPGLARVHLIGMHVLLVGFGVLSAYGLLHLWVPRWSGVPAIAAGAIKGELHSTLLGIVGLSLGFALDNRVLLVGLGFFVFVGFFTFMGVLGANIMKNKSRTQRVTPEFSYIPWTFAGVAWLICGVLMGLFLPALPASFVAEGAAFRFAHVHFALLAGLGQLAMAAHYRLLPAWRGVAPPPFARAAFLAFNLGFLLLVAARFSSITSTLFHAASALVLLGAILHIVHAVRLLSPGPAAAA